MITLVTGASGSGKSAFAEQLVLESGYEKRYYIATMKPFDDECRERIRRHQLMREKKHFCTLEQYGGMKDLHLPAGSKAILLECLSNYTANLYFAGERPWNVTDLENDILQLAAQEEDLILVTNEIFSDGCFYNAEMLSYIRTLGELNIRLAKRADRVAELVFGIPVWHKGGR